MEPLFIVLLSAPLVTYSDQYSVRGDTLRPLCVLGVSAVRSFMGANRTAETQSTQRIRGEKPPSLQSPMSLRLHIFVVSAVAKLQTSSVYLLIISVFNRIAT